MDDLSQRKLLLDVRETRNVAFRDVELRASADGKGLHFRGYASVTETPYEMSDMFGPYDEIVRAGSFTKTLSEGADVGLVINHEGIPLARTKPGTLTLTEDGTGLLADAPTLDPASPLVQTVRSAMERGDLDEMSMAFRVARQEWSPDYMQRDIQEINLHKGDVSIVNYGANPATAGATLRSLAAAKELRGISVAQLVDAFRQLAAGEVDDDSVSFLGCLIDLAARGDETSATEARTALAELVIPETPSTIVDVPLDLTLYRAQADRLTLLRH